MVVLGIQLPMDDISALCERHAIRRLALFGSVLSNRLRPDSDLDVLVEFKPGKTPGLGFFRIQRELSELLGRKVDLNTPQDLSRYFRDDVLATAQTIYGED